MTPTYIMGVPWWPQRTKGAVELARATGGTVVWDEEHSIMDTWRKTMRASHGGPGIFLEDDVILGPQWRVAIEKVIEEHPLDVIQFFALEPRKRSAYVKGKDFYSTCCYYLPDGFADSMLLFAEGWEERYTHINMRMGCDRVIGEWLAARDLRFWHHVPSLVEHRDWQSMVDPKRKTNRQARG